MTQSGRSRYTRWWIEQSGLSRDELVGLAIGLGGDAPPAAKLESGSGRRLFGDERLASAERGAGYDNLAA